MSRENTKSNTENVLEISNLCVEYRTRDSVVKAVNGLDLTLKKGQALGVVGETGAGKTTTGLAVLGLIPNPPGVVTEGKIILDGQDVLTKDARYLRGIRGKQVSMIFQDPMTSLNPVLPVNEQIAEVIRTHNKQLKPKEALEAAGDMLELVGIPRDRGGEYPHQFSGGMKQRVVIAMALANSPQLLIADEPTSALDVTIQAQVMEMIQDLIEKQGTSLILITHDLGLVATSCDDVAVVYAGEIIEYGSKEEIYDHPSHPYTIGLFGAIPNLESDVRRLANIEGLPPDPSNLPTGCSFAPRCPYATEECRTKPPKSEQIAEKHYCSCYIGRQKRGAV